ncbi:PAS domain-containing protein [Pseudomonas sp. 2FG]|uniref:PAS domain-containing protein n=1 Tax=Pseudomonas sp. 2FG TaxID=2502191 RepID=UPI0010F5B808|nr:PAS domain-containing protein [Pseudomonas sp. 2FG]
MSEHDQQLLVRALEAATNAILITDRTGCIVWLNDAFCRLSGYPRQELIGQTPNLLYSGRQSSSFYQAEQPCSGPP